jgi:hypothetical protein
MRRVILGLCFLMLALAPVPGTFGTALAQQVRTSITPTSPLDSTVSSRVEAAFRSGNPALILADAADPIDLAIFGHGASYTKSQAAVVLLDFFRRHPPAQVSFEDEVVSENRRSVIGTYLEVGAAEPAAVFVRLRARGNRWEIRSIRIERNGRR